MGFNQFMERKAQQEILKRAIDAELIAATCVGMVFGPLWMVLETGDPTRDQVDTALEGWLNAWQHVRHLSDRNLHRNRPYYLVQPNVRLSPLLEEFEGQLKRNLSDGESDAATIVARVKQAFLELSTRLFEFHQWAKNEAGPVLSLNLESYESTAAKRAQKYWQPALRALFEAMDQ